MGSLLIHSCQFQSSILKQWMSLLHGTFIWVNLRIRSWKNTSVCTVSGVWVSQWVVPTWWWFFNSRGHIKQSFEPIKQACPKRWWAILTWHQVFSLIPLVSMKRFSKWIIIIAFIHFSLLAQIEVLTWHFRRFKECIAHYILECIIHSAASWLLRLKAFFELLHVLVL